MGRTENIEKPERISMGIFSHPRAIRNRNIRQGDEMEMRKSIFLRPILSDKEPDTDVPIAPENSRIARDAPATQSVLPFEVRYTGRKATKVADRIALLKLIPETMIRSLFKREKIL